MGLRHANRSKALCLDYPARLERLTNQALSPICAGTFKGEDDASSDEQNPPSAGDDLAVLLSPAGVGLISIIDQLMMMNIVQFGCLARVAPVGLVASG